MHFRGSSLTRKRVLNSRCECRGEGGWALRGYRECLDRLGAHGLVAMVKPRLDLATAWADIPFETSCCRQVPGAV